MAGTFSPFGLRYDRSFSTSNNSTDGFREFELDPTFSGYAGDLAVPFIGMLSGREEGVNSATYDGIAVETRVSKYIYPCPAYLPSSSNNSTTPVPFIVQGYAPLLGVFASFEYYPIGGNGQLFRGNYYVKNTAMPGTKVIAKVICDPNANYDVQYKTRTEYPTGLQQNALYTSGFLFNDNGYYKQFTFQNANSVLTDVTAYVWFPEGSTENGGGSTSYYSPGNGIGQMLSNTAPPVIPPLDPALLNKGWSNNQNLIITGLAKEENNKWADPSAGITAQNNIVQVKLCLSFAQMFDDTCSN